VIEFADLQQYLFHECALRDDIDKISNALVEIVENGVPIRVCYESVPVAALGAVFSLNVRPQSWQNVIARFCVYSGWDQFDQDHKSLDFLSMLPCVVKEESAREIFGSRHRTSPKSGILKGEASRQFVEVLGENQIQKKSDITPERVFGAFRRIKQIPGQASGISFVYFLMLLGFDGFVKPDRQVVRYVEKELGREVRPTYAAEVVRQSAPKLGVSPAGLDLAIFNRMTQP